MTTQNAELSRRIFEDVWNRKNLSAIDDLISADYIHHDPNSPPANGIDGYKQFVNHYMSAFPDAHFTIEDAFTQAMITRSRTKSLAGQSSALTKANWPAYRAPDAAFPYRNQHSPRRQWKNCRELEQLGRARNDAATRRRPR